MHLFEAMAALSLATKVVEKAEDLRVCETKLLSCTLIALDCEGVNLGRTGELTIIQIASRSHCFLFDVLDKNRAIVDFLKNLLENLDIVKIVHDVKMDSDALYHCLGITVNNVHDTQGWDKIIAGREDNLNRTLERNNCKPNVERDSNVYRLNSRFWAQRPLTEMMIDWAAGDVGCLFELYDAQIRYVAANDDCGALETMCMDECNERLTLRDKIHHIYKIGGDKVGLFIGRGGQNIKYLRDEIPGTFYQLHQGDRSSYKRDISVYAPDEEAMIQALGRLKRFA